METHDESVTPSHSEAERKKHARRTNKGWRRPNGDGSIFPVEVKRSTTGRITTYYRGVKTVTIGGMKKRVVVQAQTYQLAREKLDDKIMELKVGYGLEPIEKLPVKKEYELLTVEKCMNDWLEERRKDDLRPETLRMYDARIRNHILPEFADQPVRTLTYDQLREFFKETLPAKGLGASSIHQTFVTFKSALSYYQRDRIISSHPMVGISVVKQNTRSIEDRTQIRRASKFLNEYLLKEARKVDQEARWFLGLLGLRQGEALGMTDDCLVTRGKGAEKTRRIVIKHQLKHVSAQHGCGVNSKSGKWLCGKKSTNCPQRIGEPHWELSDAKTESGHREIVITERAWEMLIAHRKKQQDFRKTKDFHPDPSEGMNKLLFTRKDGKPIYAQRDRTALTQIISNIKNLPENMTVHTLRHVATTRLIDGNADREDLITMMGWSPKNADAQISTYSSADTGKKASKTTTAYIENFYPTEK